MIAAANEIVGKPYKYGGGHGDWEDSGYDCSGSESYALHGAGLVSRPLNSTEFMSWGEPGEGQWITSYANSGHSFLVVAGLRFDTGYNNQGNGPRWSEKMRPADGYTVRHPERSLVLVVLAIASHRALFHDRPVAAAPLAEEEQRDQQADDPDHHQDDPDGRDLDARNISVDGEVEDRPDGDQKE